MKGATFFSVDAGPAWRWRALAWATDRFDPVTYFADNALPYPNGGFPNRLAAGARRVIPFSGHDDLQTLQTAHDQRPSWLVGFLSYDLKNQLERLDSRHPDRLGFPVLFFYEPAILLDFTPDGVWILADDADAVFRQIDTYRPTGARLPANVAVQSRVRPETYRQTVRRIQEHIRAGDVYELNYCLEFFADGVVLDPVTTYRALSDRSPMPFATLVKQGERYLLGASPERFLKKDGRRVLSQPIKGTIRRGASPADDERLRQQLRASEKEQAENLMIVDLVRNDLARSAETGSVRVDELFGIYTFRQVHQMISTVSATLRPDVPFTDAIRHAFPMGSMTGAPKIRAMQLIDELEASRRGLFSGAVGFITPDGDFDFNVVIRSLFYRADTRYVSFSVGSAITYDADPAQEYEECLLKAGALRSLLTGS